MKFLGSSKISTKYRISIPQDAVEKMNVDIGESVLFYVDENGNIILKKA